MRIAVLSALLLLAACRDERPPLPTAAESEQLNEVEEMLNREADAQPTRDQKGPADRSTGPSQ